MSTFCFHRLPGFYRVHCFPYFSASYNFSSRISALLFFVSTRLGILLLCAASLFSHADDTQADDTQADSREQIKVEDAYVRDLIPGQEVTAGFFTLSNPTDTAQVLVSAQSEFAGAIEIHTHLNDNGVLRMRRVPELTVEANSRLQFKPGGYHLMLFRVKPLTVPAIPVKLQFQSGESLQIQMRVQSVLDE